MSARSFFLLFLTVFLFFSLAASFSALGQDKPSPAAANGPEAKLVKLPSDKVMLRQALDEVNRQTGIRVEDFRGLPDHPLQLALKQRSFWQTIDAIAAADDARITLFPTSGRILLEKRGPNYQPPPLCYDGRFRLSVKKVTTSRDLEVRADVPNRGATTIALEVAWDPELQPLYLETRPHHVRLEDDMNHVLILPEDGSSVAPVDGRIATAIDLRLPPLPRTVAKIRSLQGELSMIGPSKMLPFKFDTPLDQLAKFSANAPERTILKEGVTCHISGVKLAADHWTISVELNYPAGMKQLDSNQSWVVNNEMTLESTRDKKRFPSTNYVLTSARRGHAVLSYHFRDKGDLKRGKPGDWKLIYRAPADLIEAPIKFVFKDLPLP